MPGPFQGGDLIAGNFSLSPGVYGNHPLTVRDYFYPYVLPEYGSDGSGGILGSVGQGGSSGQVAYVCSTCDRNEYVRGSRGSSGTGGNSSGIDWLNVAAANVTIWSAATSIAVNGPKPRYIGPRSWASQVKAGVRFSNQLGYLGLGLTGMDMVINGVNTSNTLDAAFGTISFARVPGAVVGGVYFGSNLITQGITGQSIGQHVDNNFYIIPVATPNTPFILIPKN